MNCEGMHAITKVMSCADITDESINTSIGILEQLGEAPLRPVGDLQLANAIKSMNATINKLSDEAILNMHGTKERKVVTLMKVYTHLVAYIFRFRKSSLIAASGRGPMPTMPIFHLPS